MWGNRTTNGEVYTGRNLDWLTDTGVNEFKLVTVYSPDGQTPHATGTDTDQQFAPLIVMMDSRLRRHRWCAHRNEQGWPHRWAMDMPDSTLVSLTLCSVHEANLESDQDSFNGFPWTLRLRTIMQDAANLDQAKAIWEATNNT